MLSAICCNLDQSNILSSGKDWNHFSGLTDWKVFYAAFNSISVISRWQLTLFMSFLGFSSTKLGLWIVLPMDTPLKKPRGSSVARTQDPWITSQTLYHWATQDPSFFRVVRSLNCVVKGKGLESEGGYQHSQWHNYSWCLSTLSLTINHTILTLNDLEKKPFENSGNRKKCKWPAFSSFTIMFLTLSKTKIIIFANLILSSANAFNLDQSKILSFSKELIRQQILRHV